MGEASQDIALARRHAHQIAVCGSKAVFRRRGQAMIFADQHRVDQIPYRCQICGLWHLTSRRRSELSFIHAEIEGRA